jgi:magnesium transporter
MQKHNHSRKKTRGGKLGLPPGALVHVGEVKTRQAEISLIRYSSSGITQQTSADLEGLDFSVNDQSVLWVNIYGLHQPELIAKVGRAFELHALTLEDILNTQQRPKVDTYADCLYLVTRFFSYSSASMDISSEQVSMVLGRNFVLTFQERRTGSFDPVREHLQADEGQLRKSGADYLAYTLLDIIVDRYFLALEQIGDDCETLEDALLRKPASSLLHNIHKLKRQTMELRHAVWPLREVVNVLIRNESGFFHADTLPYLRDVYDHTVHFIESLESLRDMLAGMLDIYLSTVSNRVNMEVRALTVVAMLFMPATLIAGIFGMNFHWMPWLTNPNGFWFALGMMAGIALLMGAIFWRRQWLSR